MATRGRPDRPAAPLTLGSAPVLEGLLDATRALLWIESADHAAGLCRDLIAEFGGTVVPAEGATSDALPIDVSFGLGQPMLPLAPEVSVARMLIERYLPGFVRDAYRALEVADRTSRLSEAASIDPLTGLANRRMLRRVLSRLRPDDTVILIDLDNFKRVNDERGHPEGDRVLRAFGAVLRSTARGGDHPGRHGGEEFVVVLTDSDAEVFLSRLTRAWERERPLPVTFSAGIAVGTGDALLAADRAMYRAKADGRDRWEWALAGDYA